MQPTGTHNGVVFDYVVVPQPLNNLCGFEPIGSQNVSILA